MCCIWGRVANWRMVITQLYKTQNELYSTSFYQSGLSAFRGKIQPVDSLVLDTFKSDRSKVAAVGWQAPLSSFLLSLINPPCALIQPWTCLRQKHACGNAVPYDYKHSTDLAKQKRNNIFKVYLISLFFSTEQMGNIRLRYCSSIVIPYVCKS